MNDDKLIKKVKALTQQLNEFKQLYPTFTGKVLYEYAKKHSIPYYTSLPKVLLSCNLITRNTVSSPAKFINSEPIHFAVLVEPYKDLVVKFNKKHPRANTPGNEQASIALLKSLGYKILKPVTQFKEV